MHEIELVPTLSECIHTLAAKRHDEAVRQLLAAGKPMPELQETEKLLRKFLETADFRQLRAESEALLAMNRKVKFVLRLDRGTLKYKLQLE